jgi:RNA polymerase sigma-70 factor, ECF subfamily
MHGPLEGRYLAYLETLAQLRPSLHRYCSRMVGSVLDGEDVVQEALLLAYRKLDTADDSRPLGPWLFRIAHNCCIDFLRHREVRMKAEAASVQSDQTEPPQTHGLILGRAVEYLVLSLPPKERACVLLKDVGVEKVAFGENSRRFGDRKCPAESIKSLVGHPSAMKFMSASRG